jgi:hypothetical protein
MPFPLRTAEPDCGPQLHHPGIEFSGGVAVLFDGAGTKWVAALSEREHRYHGLFEDVRDRITGACAYCANAFGVREQVEAAEVALLDDFEEHPSLRSYLADGYQVLTF